MKALILVDLQNDFMPYGTLPVPDGSSVVPLANILAKKFDKVVATQDWHPETHKSFAENHKGKEPGETVQLNGKPQILWPNHCIQGTSGADFHPKLDKNLINKVFQKGTNKEIDSYSGFFDNNREQATGLEKWLKENNVSEVYVLGLATDYCVKFTALDAAKLGFKTYLVADACRGVELNPGDVGNAISEMQDAGVSVISSRELQISF